jgi:anti-sigma regulatory factor (Ser/Thr protein kinase)
VSPRLSDQLSLEFLADEREVRAVRMALTGWLGETRTDGPLRDEIVLAVSELVTNAVLASPDGATILLRADHDGDRCHVEVTNHGTPADVTDALARALPTIEHANGRGLHVAQALADRLAVTSPRPGMVTVSFERRV